MNYGKELLLIFIFSSFCEYNYSIVEGVKNVQVNNAENDSNGLLEKISKGIEVINGNILGIVEWVKQHNKNTVETNQKIQKLMEQNNKFMKQNEEHAYRMNEFLKQNTDYLKQIKKFSENKKGLKETANYSPFKTGCENRFSYTFISSHAEDKYASPNLLFYVNNQVPLKYLKNDILELLKVDFYNLLQLGKVAYSENEVALICSEKVKGIYKNIGYYQHYERAYIQEKVKEYLKKENPELFKDYIIKFHAMKIIGEDLHIVFRIENRSFAKINNI